MFKWKVYYQPWIIPQSVADRPETISYDLNNPDQLMIFAV
jgi:hypothetical protein